MFSLQLGHTDRFHDLFTTSALVNDEIDTPLIFEGIRGDLPALDGWATEERLDISRLSLAGFAQVQGDYGILNCGAVIGRDLGPYLVGRPEAASEDPVKAEILVSGISTTFYLPLCVYLGSYPTSLKTTSNPVPRELVEGPSRLGIVEAGDLALARGAGLEVIADLGDWWAGQTGLPLPLEVFAVRRVLGSEAAREIDTSLRRSFILAQSDKDALSSMIEKSIPDWAGMPASLAQVPYLNELSSDLGPEGQEAVEALFTKAESAKLVPKSGLPLWAY
jgi:1,4-dihydroxy-6-naphthoate synthase